MCLNHILQGKKVEQTKARGFPTRTVARAGESPWLAPIRHPLGNPDIRRNLRS